MRTILTVLLAASFIAAAGLVAAADDPTHPDCNADQRDPSTSSDRVSDRSADLRSEDSGTGGCEGEHWDGHDPLSDEDGTKAVTSQGNVGVIVGSDSEYDKNSDAADPVRLRVIVNSGGAAFTRTAIFGLGIASIYAGQNSGGGATAATYLEDHSDQLGDPACVGATAVMTANEGAFGDHHTVQDGDCNMLAAVVHAAHITMGQDVGEEEYDASTDPEGCDQFEYQGGDCKRDNTAITVEVLA